MRHRPRPPRRGRHLQMAEAGLPAAVGYLVYVGEVVAPLLLILELQAFYLASALAIALLGAGRFSAGGVHGRWN